MNCNGVTVCHTCGGDDLSKSTYTVCFLLSPSFLSAHSFRLPNFVPSASCGARRPQAMSNDQDHGRAPSPWLSNQHTSQTGSPTGISAEPESPRLQHIPMQANSQSRLPYASPPSNTTRLPDRPNVPTRSSTLGSSEPDRNLSTNAYPTHARSEDLSHGSSSSNNYPSGFPGSSPRPSPAFLASAGSSRPSSPPGSKSKHPSSSGHSERSGRPMSVASISSAHSGSSSQSGNGRPPPTSASSTSASLTLT